MKSILIADDEKIEREGIKFLLMQSGFEFKVVEAMHGKAAYEYLKHNKVDILFTDVKMPFMDGLQLIKEAVLLNKDIKCIVFSGFSEFEYAQRAIRMGVNNYILKPVDPEEFHRTIQKIWNELEEIEHLANVKQKESNYLWEHVLFQLVNGIPLVNIKDCVNIFSDMSLLRTYNRMILIESDHNFFEKVNEVLPEDLKRSFQLRFDYLNLNIQQSILLFHKAEKIDYIVLARRMFDYIKELYNESCYFAVSNPFQELKEIPEIFQQLEVLMENKFYQPKDHVFVEGQNNLGLTRENYEDELIQNILKDIHNKNFDGILKNYQILCSKYMEHKDFSQIYIKFVFSNLMKEMNAVISMNDDLYFEKEIEELYRSTQIKEVIRITNRSLERFKKTLEDHGPRTEIQAIKNYIYENYQKDISVDWLAEKVFLTPSYVSYIFKKETGCNLNKFIKMYRMNQAKVLLLTTQMKIVNICELVGYINVSYFCQNFKETFGVSPEKFRQSGEANEKDKTNKF